MIVMTVKVNSLSKEAKEKQVQASTYCDYCRKPYREKAKIYTEEYGVICEDCWAKITGKILEEHTVAFID